MLARLNVDPPDWGQVFFVACLAAKQTQHLRVIVAFGQVEGNAMAAAAIIERHHQAGLMRRGVPADDIETEELALAESLACNMFNMFEIRLTDQRTVGKNPKRVVYIL